MTVTIEENGILGPVDGISEKDEAVANKGATIFIVLKGQAVAYVQECDERKQGPFMYRTCKSETKDLSSITKEGM